MVSEFCNLSLVIRSDTYWMNIMEYDVNEFDARTPSRPWPHLKFKAHSIAIVCGRVYD